MVSVKQAMQTIQHSKDSIREAKEYIDKQVAKAAKTLQKVVGDAIVVENSKHLLVYFCPNDFARAFLTDKAYLVTVIERQGACKCEDYCSAYDFAALDDDEEFQCGFHGFYRDPKDPVRDEWLSGISASSTSATYAKDRNWVPVGHLDCKEVSNSDSMEHIMNNITVSSSRHGRGRRQGDGHEDDDEKGAVRLTDAEKHRMIVQF